jgi:hypothetical protein
MTGFEACDSSQRVHRACGTSQANVAAGRKLSAGVSMSKTSARPWPAHKEKLTDQCTVLPMKCTDKEHGKGQNRCWRETVHHWQLGLVLSRSRGRAAAVIGRCSYWGLDPTPIYRALRRKGTPTSTPVARQSANCHASRAPVCFQHTKAVLESQRAFLQRRRGYSTFNAREGSRAAAGQ